MAIHPVIVTLKLSVWHKKHLLGCHATLYAYCSHDESVDLGDGTNLDSSSSSTMY